MTSKITTKKGDKGTTSLYSGERVPKNNINIKIVGIIDELVSHLGLARVYSQVVNSELEQLQKDLFVLASDIATTQGKRKIKRIDKNFIDIFEKEHSRISEKVQFPKDFVLPGGVNSISGAQIDICRTIARRLEVEIIDCSFNNNVKNVEVIEKLNEKNCILTYVNRLSDYLWLLARLEEGKSKMQKD